MRNTGAASNGFRSLLDYPSRESLLSALQNGFLDGNGITGDSTVTVAQLSSDWRCTQETGSLLVDIEAEVDRLEDLRRYHVVGERNGIDGLFDEVTRRSCAMFEVPWASVGFMDLGCQWAKSHDLVTPRKIDRRNTFCTQTMLRHREDPLLEVCDLLSDDRFCRLPFVTHGRKFRYYAGTQVLSEEGRCLGTVYILSNKPRERGLCPKQRAQLLEIAREVQDLLTSRRCSLGRASSTGKRSSSHFGRKALLFQPTNCILAPIRPSPKRSRSHIAPVIESCTVDAPFDQDAQYQEISFEDDICPTVFLLELVKCLFHVDLKVVSAHQLGGFFANVSDEQLAAYNVDILSKARENDIDSLRTILNTQGRSALECFNQFGEGLLNLACRRGFVQLVQFLLSEEVNLNPRICDDYGRTPVHDACWNPEPQIEICSWLLKRDPFLFLVSDKRGFCPFDYARRNDWKVWRSFIWNHRAHLKQVIQHQEVLSLFLSKSKSTLACSSIGT